MNAVHPFLEHAVHLTRRELFRRGGLGLGAIALASLLNRETRAGAGSGDPAPARGNPLAPKKPHFAAKAKRVIYLHMVGAPSHLDLFDAKPELLKRDGEPCPKKFIEGKRFAFIRGHPRLLGSKYKFAKHGKGGVELSELLPELATVADDLCVVKTVRTDEFNHGPAQLFLH